MPKLQVATKNRLPRATAARASAERCPTTIVSTRPIAIMPTCTAAIGARQTQHRRQVGAGGHGEGCLVRHGSLSETARSDGAVPPRVAPQARIGSATFRPDTNSGLLTLHSLSTDH